MHRRNFQGKGLRVVASGAMGTTGGTAEITESEKAPNIYFWPDKKVSASRRFSFIYCCIM